MFHMTKSYAYAFAEDAVHDSRQGSNQGRADTAHCGKSDKFSSQHGYGTAAEICTMIYPAALPDGMLLSKQQECNDICN